MDYETVRDTLQVILRVCLFLFLSHFQVGEAGFLNSFKILCNSEYPPTYGFLRTGHNIFFGGKCEFGRNTRLS
jgi:hypothetical protein